LFEEATMRRSRLSLAGLSILFALGLALWEVYFFWLAGSLGLEGSLGLFTAERLGFNMAWLAAIYLTFQLTSIPFALPSTTGRFIGVVDGMASLVPLAVVLIAVFGKPAFDRHRAALGGGVPAHLHHLGRSVRRIHVQYRAQPPHHGCLAGRVGLTWPRPPVCVSVTSRH
jgi:hypothetical protein